MPTRRPVRLVQSEVWLGRAEFDNMISQREPQPVEFEGMEVVPCPATDTTPLEVRPLTGRSPRAATVAPLFSPVAANAEDDGLIRLDDLEPAATEIPNQPSPAKPRRSPRWAAVGVLGLVLVGGAASVPLLTSHSAAPRETARTAAPSSPVTVIPEPDPGDTDRVQSIDAEPLAPVAAPNPAAAAPVRSEPAAVPASRPARSDSTSGRTTSSAKPVAQAPAPPPSGQLAADEIRTWWSKAAGAYGPRNSRWTHGGTHWDPESSPWP